MWWLALETGTTKAAKRQQQKACPSIDVAMLGKWPAHQMLSCKWPMSSRESRFPFAIQSTKEFSNLRV